MADDRDGYIRPDPAETRRAEQERELREGGRR